MGYKFDNIINNQKFCFAEDVEMQHVLQLGELLPFFVSNNT